MVICILGVTSVVYSRYELLHPSSAGQPTVGTNWFVGLSIDICGVQEPNLPSNPVSKVVTGYTTTGDGVIRVSPTKSSEAGGNATLGRFVDGYKGLQLTPIAVEYPGKKTSTVGRLFSNGDKCRAGTPYAGKVGTLQVKMWPTYQESAKPVVVGNPVTLRFADTQLITIAYVPYGTTISRPPASVTSSLVGDISASQSASTTVPGVTTPVSTPVSTPVTIAPATPVTTAKSGSTKS